jgi:adenylosuccinate synthase
MNLWIGPNSGFFIDQFYKELDQTGYRQQGNFKIINSDLYVHERAVVVNQSHIDAESPTGAQSTEHISSTMSGSGAAYTQKAMRKADVRLARDIQGLTTLTPSQFTNSIRHRLDNDETFMHEVSQGFALSQNYGTHYPFCTFRDCTPQQAYADMGLLPYHVGDVYLNIRTFPIRVGNNFRDGKQTGYSGDCLPDQKEMTWEEIGRNAEMPQSEIDVLAEKERTTVTKKIRRVFSFSWDLLKHSAEFCGATKLILNFSQYIHWSSYKMRGEKEQVAKLHPKIRVFIDQMEETTNLPVVMIGTGPNHEDCIWL